MAQASDGSFQPLPNQGLFNVKDALCLLSCLIRICFSLDCSEMLLIPGNPPLDEAIAELVFITVTLIILGAQGMNGFKFHLAPSALVRGAMQIATNKQLLLLCSFALMVNGAHAHDHNEGFQCCVCADPNVWEIRDYALKAAAVTLLAGLLTFGGAEVARRMMFNYQPPVPPASVPDAVPTIPEAAPELQIYPAVQGDDIDDVLVNAPLVTRLNTPLGWL